jgi:uncharacterized protein (TIGR00290 family)
MNRKKVWMSWSSGKDSAFALWELLSREDLEVTGLLTTITETYNRVSMHAVREELLDMQAASLGLPIHKVRIPSTCTNEIYEQRMNDAVLEARAQEVSYLAFGDLFLQDVRQYRVDLLSGSGMEPLFPLWQRSTPKLAHSMIDAGFKAVLTCIDPKKLPPSFVGRNYDRTLLSELPVDVDPCGENGEFHTFVFDAPIFRESLHIEIGERVMRDGFMFADVLPLRLEKQ